MQLYALNNVLKQLISSHVWCWNHILNEMLYLINKMETKHEISHFSEQHFFLILGVISVVVFLNLCGILDGYLKCDQY